MNVYLGQKIRSLRKSKGLTQFDLEKKTGIKREYLSKIENDELNNPTFFTLLKICEGIGVSVTELISFENSLPSPKVPQINVLSSENQQLSDNFEKGHFVVLPVISGEFAAWDPKFICQDDIKDYVIVQSDFLPAVGDQHRYRCIQLADDDYSMSPVLSPRSVVCIDSNTRDLNDVDRKMVALRDNDGRCIICYMRAEKSHILGIPENLKDYSPLVFPNQKFNRVLGQIVWYQRPLVNGLAK